MGSRTSFRPRPLDTARQLNIVRDVKELDDGEQKVSRDIVHSHEALDKDNEEVLRHLLLALCQCASCMYSCPELRRQITDCILPDHTGLAEMAILRSVRRS